TQRPVRPGPARDGARGPRSARPVTRPRRGGTDGPALPRAARPPRRPRPRHGGRRPARPARDRARGLGRRLVVPADGGRHDGRALPPDDGSRPAWRTRAHGLAARLRPDVAGAEERGELGRDRGRARDGRRDPRRAERRRPARVLGLLRHEPQPHEPRAARRQPPRPRLGAARGHVPRHRPGPGVRERAVVGRRTVGTTSGQIGSVATSLAQARSTCRTFAGSHAAGFDTQVTSVVFGSADTTVATGYGTLNAQVMADLYGATTTSSFSLAGL